MSPDEAALIRLWKEKRGEVEPEDLQRQSHRPTRRRHRGAQPDLVRAQHRARRHRRPALGPASCASLPGGDPGRVRQRPRRRVRGQVHAALVVLGRGGGGKAHGPAAAQHVGDQRPVGGPLDHHRRRQMDRDDHSRRRALPAFPRDGRASVLALRPDRRDASPLRHRTTAAADRGGPDRRHERVQLMGRVRRPLLRHPFCLSRP